MSNLLKPGRDDREKSWGCISASAFAHVVVLSLLALAAPRVQDLNGLPQANAGETIEMQTLSSDPKVAARVAQNREVENHAVLLADSSDPNAVEMAPKKPTAQAKPVNKKTNTLPSKKEAKAPVVAREDGDVEIKSALKVAREEQLAPEQKSEAQPETATEEIEKDIPAPIKEDAAPEDTAEEITPPQPQAEPAPVAEEVTPPLPQKEVAKPVPAPAPVSAPATVSAPVRMQAPVAHPQPVYVVRSAPTAVSASGYGTPSRVAGLGPSGQTVHPLSTVGGGAVGAGSTGTANGERIRDVSELIARPGNPRVIYPTPDRMAHREGTSVVIGNVNADGSMGNVYLERSSGSRSMDLAALQTFKKWSFMPGQGGPVRKPFRFQLVGDAQEVPAQLKRQ